MSHAVSCPNGFYPLSDIMSYMIYVQICRQRYVQTCVEPHLPSQWWAVGHHGKCRRWCLSWCNCKRLLGRSLWTHILWCKGFSPNMPSNQAPQMTNIYQRQMWEMQQVCAKDLRGWTRNLDSSHMVRIRWHGPTTEVFLKRLASMLAEKRDEPYSLVMSWLRCWIRFALVHSAV